MFSEPLKIVSQAGVLPGQKIADIGAGSGYYVTEIAKALMSSGTVYAIDINKELLEKIKNKTKHENLSNVEVIWGDFELENGTKLKTASIDMVFACNVFFQTEDKRGAIKEIKRILVPHGKVVFVDWSESSNIGPKDNMLVKEWDILDLFEKNGFVKEKSLFAGEHHYGIIFKKL
jgi:ubiquinone/menaquinone biosynthesis C-methylase UbiE